MGFLRAGLRRAAPLAEVIAILIGGNLLAKSLLKALFPPAMIATAFDPGLGNGGAAARSAALVLAVRFAVLLAAGFIALRAFTRLSPVQAIFPGRTLPLRSELAAGAALFAIASFPWKLTLLLNALHPFGAAPAAWDDVRAAGWSLGVVWLLAARAVVLPPLLEEPFARGYLLARLRGAGWGAGEAVLLSALVFQLSHGHFYSKDPVVLALLASGLFAAACWAYATIRTGSLVPAIVAHALGNLPEPASPAGLGALLLAMAAVIFLARAPIARAFAGFRGELSAMRHRGGLAAAALILVGGMTFGALHRQYLPAIGGLAFLLWLIAARREPAPAG